MPLLNPGIPSLNLSGEAGPARFDDRALMTFGIPGFGISIPWLTGLWGPVRPGEALFWLGQLLFVALAAAIWLGNRWLLLKQRQHFDWFSHPLRKLSMLVTANVLYTAPVTVGGLLLWYAAAGQPASRAAIEVVVLTNVICVLFVTHAYETMFLIRERQSDRVRVERLERLRAQAELGALKAQVDPHFLFNSLNTLGHLVTADPQRGRSFCDALAEMYRYVLASREHDLVPLAEELAFARVYHQLLAMRFGEAIRLEIAPSLDTWPARIVPLALQTLIENAVKHNQAGEDTPLCIHVEPGEGHVCVTNAVLPRRSRLPSAGLGLANLDERCRSLTGRPLQRLHDAQRFEVCVPLMPLAT